MRICSDHSSRIYKLIFVFLFSAVLFHSCDEDEPAPPINPEMKIFAGTWEGTTSQKAMVRIVVSENDLEQIVVSRAEMNYLVDGNLHQLLLDDQQGLSFISSGMFDVLLPDGGVMRGNFAAGLLTGEFMTYPSPGELSVSFKAVPENDSLSLYSLCRTSFDQSNGKKFNMVQDQKNYFPVAHCVDADSGYKAYSAMHYGSWENGGAPYFWIEAGLMETPANVADVFVPGSKKFSRHATDGFSLNYIDTDQNYYRFFALDDSLMPVESYFEILQLEQIETGPAKPLRYKFTAGFDVWLYTYNGDSVHLQNGFYSGFVEDTVIPE